jgi:hypothetical protein
LISNVKTWTCFKKNDKVEFTQRFSAGNVKSSTNVFFSRA